MGVMVLGSGLVGDAELTGRFCLQKGIMIALETRLMLKLEPALVQLFLASSFKMRLLLPAYNPATVP
jgi:hypothetical protein